MKIIKVLVIGLVTWAISDVVFNILYQSIDNAIASSGENITGLLKAMKVIAGLLAFDGVSFVVGLIAAIITVFKLRD
ncbi:MAG: hypothetical protein Q7I99_06095, partial [Acholeplasmataceae bacterium]|nr:hypothetical protein [Acholeplasmataceae bacterium]